MMFIDILHDVDGSVKQSLAFSSHTKSTIFRYEYLIAVVDEVHLARKFNKLHMGYQGLQQQAQAIPTMTAMLVTTKLQVRSCSSFLLCTSHCTNVSRTYGSSEL